MAVIAKEEHGTVARESGVDFLCEIKRDDLLKVLSGVQAVVNRKASNAVLANVLIEASGDSVSVTGTSLDLSIIVSHKGGVHGYGEVSIMGSMLFDICRKLPSGCTVSLQKLDNDEVVQVKSGCSSFQLPTIEPGRFPAVDCSHSGSGIVIPCELCFKLFDKVSFAIANDEARQFLCGTHLSIKDGDILSVVATNGHRLAMVTTKIPNCEVGAAIIPRRTVFEVMRHSYMSPKDEVQIFVQSSRAVFVFPNATIVSKLIDGHYPDTSRIIPTPTTPRCEVSSAAFIGALERVSAVLLDKNGGVSLSLKNNEIEISAHALGYGSSASEKLEVKYEGEHIDFVLNIKYLIELVAKCSSERFLFHVSAPDAPILCISDSMEGFICVIMPMRT